LLPGRAEDPDFVFRFSPGSIAELERAGPGVGDVALRLFELILDEDENTRIDIRLVATFWRLAQRGYVRLLLSSGARVAAFAAGHGVSGFHSLRERVGALRRREPYPWECS
jgi:hypothetical protein